MTVSTTWLLFGLTSLALWAGLWFAHPRKRAKGHRVVAFAELHDQRKLGPAKRVLLSPLLLAFDCLLVLPALVLLLRVPHPAATSRVAFVVDRTLSMAALDGEKTRFERGIRRIKTEVQKLGAVRGKLYLAGGRIETHAFDGAGSLGEVLDKLQVAHVEGGLSTILPLLEAELYSLAPEHVYVITDHLSDSHEKVLRQLEYPITVWMMGSRRENVYIESFAVMSGFIDQSPEKTILSYSVANDMHRKQKLFLAFYIEDELVYRPEVILQSGSRTTGTFTLSDLLRKRGSLNLQAGARLRLRIEGPDGSSIPGDAILADNEGHDKLPGLDPIILGVSDQKLLAFFRDEFGIESGPADDSSSTGEKSLANEGTSTTLSGRQSSSPEQVLNQPSGIRRIAAIDLSNPETPLRSNHIAVFNASPPGTDESLEHPSSLYILAQPSLKNIDLPESKEVAAARDTFIDQERKTIRYAPVDVVGWRSDDPLMEYLENFQVLKIQTSLYPFKWVLVDNRSKFTRTRTYTPLWMRDVIYGRILNANWLFSSLRIPIVMRGTHENQHAVIINFDISEYDLSVFKELKILLLNSIRWLSEKNTPPASVALDQGFSLTWPDDAGPFYLTEPTGAVTELPSAKVPPLTISGPYELEASGDPQLVHPFAVRVLDVSSEHRLMGTALHDSEGKRFAENKFPQLSALGRGEMQDIVIWERSVADCLFVLALLNAFIYFFSVRLAGAQRKLNA